MASPDPMQTEPVPAEHAPRTTREEWIALAREILVNDGVSNVKVMNLAQRLNVSRSSFYWFFKSRRDLLDQLLHHWEHTNTASIVEHAGRPSHTITEAVLGLFECWIGETKFDPRLDFAIREWARRSRELHRQVDAADTARIQAIAAMFRRHGYEEGEAFIRARVLYFMQVGYYALEVREPLDVRLSYTKAYIRSFTGKDPSVTELNRFRSTVRKLAADYSTEPASSVW
jgi:AcrR family transcriptional regulator